MIGEVRWSAGTPERLKMGIRFRKPVDVAIPFSVTEESVSTLQQILDALENAVPGELILLNPDLRISEVRGGRTTGRRGVGKSRFKGMVLREATGLVETVVNEKTLWEALQVCAETGKRFSGTCSFRHGRSGKGPDLFSHGTFGVKIHPVCGPKGEVRSILMFVEREDPLGLLNGSKEKRRESTKRLQQILASAASGFLLHDAIKELSNPLAHLRIQLDLLRHKLASDGEGTQAGSGRLATYVQEAGMAEKLAGGFCEKLQCLLQNTFRSDPVHEPFSEISSCLSKAISVMGLYEGFDGNSITFKAPQKMPVTQPEEQDVVMLLVIFLLLSKDCLANGSDMSIVCETETVASHLIVKILHTGHIRQDGYLDILFHHDPLETYFLKSHAISFMDTLLYYANFLLKKNDIKIKITNILGHFSLSLIIPVRKQVPIGKA